MIVCDLFGAMCKMHSCWYISVSRYSSDCKLHNLIPVSSHIHSWGTWHNLE